MSNSEVERRQKEKKNKMNIICPDIIKNYNQYITGGVDVMDHKLLSYGLERKARIKFYLLPFFDLLNISMTNSFVV
jgi:Transposase IS4